MLNKLIDKLILETKRIPRKIKRFLITYKCSCGNKLYQENTYQDNYQYLDTVCCEFDIKCSRCNKIVGHWAYGHEEPPRNRLEELHMKIDSWKVGFKELFKKKDSDELFF